jgi:rod shape-determining protein MreC
LAQAVDTRRFRLVVALLAFAHVVLVSRQVDTGGGKTMLDQTLFVALAPLQGGVAGLISELGGAWAAYVDLRGAQEENLRLREQVRDLELRFAGQRELAEQAARLRELLELRQILPHATLVAEVIARDGLPSSRTVTLDKGRREGVTLDAPVLCATGVVGRVIGLGPHAARVQLLLDADSGVGVRVERSRVAGVVTGQPGYADARGRELLMKYVPILADVRAGDVVVTSGLDQIYPSGLMVGRVSSVESGSGVSKDVSVSPSADFERLEQVLVVRMEKADTRITESVK